ncbi:MAG TPA: amidohydrolase family protein [Burkholderiaceae bacterium]|jgi:imidazolonepropionase-like amidohydrolase|nr:amidohydrolase family protein [Burkholderiaceae bacterium]
MRRTTRLTDLFLGALAILAVSSASGAEAAGTPRPIVLKADHLFDSASGKLVDRGVVVVAGSKIQAVGSDAQIPADAQVIDLGDATLLPGFIDAHVHLQWASSNNWYSDFFDHLMQFPAEQALHGAHHAKVTLEAGVTTVRDVASNDYVAVGLRNAIKAGMIPGPRMLVSNYAIGSTAGHADQDPYPPQRIAPAGPIQGVCNGPEECRAAVRYQIKFGADLIKFMPSGGVLSLTDPVDNVQLTQDEMNAIISEAHTWGRKVAAHCHGDRAAKMAIAAGVDSIEHGTFLQDDTLLEMKRKHVYLVPTMSASYWTSQKVDTYPPVIAAKVRAASAQHQQMLQHAVKLGVPIAMGTDAAVGPHGKNALEFSLMVKNGMTPAQALIAGTASGADLLGISDQTGTLQAGKSADVVVVAGDPLADIQVTQHPILVMKEGVIYVGGK